jgi:hypothetical protein
MNEQKRKAFWKSATLWFNSLVATLAVMLPDLMLQLPVLQPYLPTDVFKWMFLGTVVGNILLRIRTSTALGVKSA